MAMVRPAEPGDCEAIAGIYNGAIAEARSTFETEPHSAADVEGWLGSPGPPLLVGMSGHAVAGWARLSPYSSRDCYAGVAEGSVYVRASERGRGLGGALALALTEEAARAGLHKIGRQAVCGQRGKPPARRPPRLPRSRHPPEAWPDRRRLARRRGRRAAVA